MQPINVTLGDDGGFTLPMEFCDAMALKPGDALLVCVEDDGIYFRTESQAARWAELMKARERVGARLTPTDIINLVAHYCSSGALA